jgi:hypothetical protein
MAQKVALFSHPAPKCLRIAPRRRGESDKLEGGGPVAGEYFEIHKSDKNNQYWWRLHSANGQIIGVTSREVV